MRLIDADALMGMAIKIDHIGEKTAHAIQWAMVDAFYRNIDKSPTVDAVPVVRCKGCKHYNTTGCSVGFGWCESMDRGVSDEFFCSCGAKMEVK
jgi:hypothetical protein